MVVNMCAVGSVANRQRKSREKLKRENPELLRAREREKWRRRCMKTKLSTDFSALPKICEPTYYKQPSSFIFGAKQPGIPEQNDYSRSMNKTCPRLMYLVDEQTYHNYIEQDAANESLKECPAMEQNLSNRLENAEQNHETEMLHRLLNSIKKPKSSQSSSVSSVRVMPLTDCLSNNVMASVKPACMASCEKVDTKKRKRKGKSIRNAKRRTIPIMWDPL